MKLESYIRDVPDFPKAGIVFKDICPLLQDQRSFRFAIDELYKKLRDKHADIVVGIESRGFILASPLAYKMKAGLVPIRKVGKLPSEVIRQEYSLEYGTSAVEMHRDAVNPGQRVLLLDDLLATGGTMCAAIKLVQQLGAEVVGTAFLVELGFLNGRKALGNNSEIISLITY